MERPPLRPRSPLNSPSPTNRPRPYNGYILAVLLVAYTAFWGLGFLSTSYTGNTAMILVSISTSLLWGVLISVLIMDWRGYFTFDGLIQWRQASNAKIVGVVVLCTVLFMFALGIYLIRKAFLYMQRRTVEEWRLTPSYRRPAIGLIVGTIVALFAFHIYANPVVGNTSTTTSNTNTSAADTSQTTQDMGTTPYVAPTTAAPTVTRIAPTHTTTPKPKPTVAPTKAPIPTQARPTPKPQPQPTQSTGINNNQWGYNFVQGNLIYYPPSNFCDDFPCITSFWEKDDPGDGYVVECSDGMYSQSGGERGACSYHGGVLRPLYSH